jgi:hypothetical protein
MFKILGGSNTILIIMVIVLGVISGKYLEMGKEGSISNNLSYKKGNFYILMSTILLITSIILSALIFFQMSL